MGTFERGDAEEDLGLPCLELALGTAQLAVGSLQLLKLLGEVVLKAFHAFCVCNYVSRGWG